MYGTSILRQVFKQVMLVIISDDQRQPPVVLIIGYLGAAQTAPPFKNKITFYNKESKIIYNNTNKYPQTRLDLGLLIIDDKSVGVVLIIGYLGAAQTAPPFKNKITFYNIESKIIYNNTNKYPQKRNTSILSLMSSVCDIMICALIIGYLFVLCKQHLSFSNTKIKIGVSFFRL